MIPLVPLRTREGYFLGAVGSSRCIFPLLLTPRGPTSPPDVIASRFLVVVLGLLHFAAPSRADVVVGGDRNEAIRQHGFPKSNAKRGNHEFFVYANGGRIEFADGKVVDVKGPLPVIAPPAPTPAAETPTAPSKPAPPKPATAVPAVKTPAPSSAPAPTPTAPSPVASSAVANQPATAAASPAPPGSTAKSPTVPPPDYAAANAAANAALSAHIEKMDTAWGEAPHLPKSHGPLDSLPSFIVGLLLRFGLTIAALKLAFKFWEMDAFWAGIFSIAGIDLALHAILELLGPATGGLTSMSAVENGIPGIVLIFTINRFCFNKRLQNAVRTASVVKLTVSILYIFGGVALLNAAFG